VIPATAPAGEDKYPDIARYESAWMMIRRHELKFRDRAFAYFPAGSAHGDFYVGKGIPVTSQFPQLFGRIAFAGVSEYDTRKTHDTPLRIRKMPRCVIQHHAN